MMYCTVIDLTELQAVKHLERNYIELYCSRSLTIFSVTNGYKCLTVQKQKTSAGQWRPQESQGDISIKGN